jgi:hypothetical protein
MNKNEMYFTKDGSYGNAEGLLVVPMSSFTAEELEQLEEASDSDRYNMISEKLYSSSDSVKLYS